MKIAGIIAEYNPFHLGHQFHIEETRRLTGCDFVVACMAGHFTQRGEPAMASKWARARMALSCGADAVFDLPQLFAVRAADAFARGGVGVLAGLGVDFLSFGSEITDLALLERLAEWRESEPEAVSRAIQARLQEGMAHARARGEAWAEALGVPAESLHRPNAALAVEYLRALRGTGVRPVAVERRGDYHAKELARSQDSQGETPAAFASASAIRAALESGEDIAGFLPEAARGQLPGKPRRSLDMLALFRLREGNFAFPDAPEGMDQLLFKAAREAGSAREAIGACKSRRYTLSRLSRAAAHALIQLDGGLAKRHPRPEYARLLGFRLDARPLLGELSRRAAIPIAANPSALRGDECFALECRATDLWALGEPEAPARRAGREWTEPVVRV